MWQNIVDVFETEDYVTCSQLLGKGWVLLLVCQNVEDDFDILKSNAVYVLGRPFSVPKDQ